MVYFEKWGNWSSKRVCNFEVKPGFSSTVCWLILLRKFELLWGICIKLTFMVTPQVYIKWIAFKLNSIAFEDVIDRAL